MEEILMSGATGILKRLVGAVSEDIALAWDVKDDLKKLQSTSEMILAVIADAEKRQEKEELVRLWLRRLKDVAYDADDVIDEFSYEDMRRNDKKDSSKHKVINFHSSSNPPLAFRLKMAKRIKEINTRLDEITRDMGRFQLEITTPIPDGESTEQLDRQDTSHVNESEIVGREDDKSQLIKLLTINTPEAVSVLSVVGMGGLGKTTLAQLVYKDELVKKAFELTAWVHVSEIFDLQIILVNIMESITETKFPKLPVHLLGKIVQEKLHGKKYLLVLDDLWNEDSEQWGSLMSVLLTGAPGSRILITTRNDQVASTVRGSIPPYSLNPLQDDVCWSIIKQKAFSPGGALNAPEMSDLGKEIAKKCCGLPLAAKFLGSLMRLKKGKHDWISIRDDDIWNTPESKRKVLPVLKLSYNYLPSHLKQCFSYCSIFPKNWEISKEMLVHLWMAEGFLKQYNIGNKRSIEDFGHDYFESLARNSFFQDFKMNKLGDIKTCKMHDVVHDLAKDVVGENEVVSHKVSELKDVSQVRRLHLDLDLDTEISTTFLKNSSNLKKLRTLLILQGSKLDPAILLENKCLRILYVGCLPALPGTKWRSSSVKLKHLRYLRLNNLDLSEVENDRSIRQVYNLETLVLSNMGIGVQILLTKIQSLKKLRYLQVSFTDMVQLPISVTSLCNLQTLDLNNCELEAIPDSISGLKNLRFLNLSVNPIEELPVSVTTLSSLETLDVNTCKNLKALPESVAGLSNLRIFDFTNCPLLVALPEDFGALAQLRSLDLERTRIKVLPESCSNLSSIEYLHLWVCELPEYVRNWTKLRRFYYNPRRNPAIGVAKLVCLESLIYSVPLKLKTKAECDVGIQELENLNTLQVLRITNLENVKDPIDAERANLKGKQNLRQLQLNWDQKYPCNDDAQVFEALQPPVGLVHLTIQNFMGRDLPAWMCVPSSLPELVWLVFTNCKEIKLLPAGIGKLPRLRCLLLEGMPSTDTFLEEEESCYSYPSCLQYLRISGCNCLAEIPSFPCLATLVLEKINHKLVCSVGRRQTSLTTLRLQNVDELVYLPLSILQNNCNLQVLQIQECNQLEGFGANDDENELYSASLETLVFVDCPVLKFLPDVRGWISLRKLIIFNCPQVKELLTYDLQTLSFLRELYVDFIQRDDQRGDLSNIRELINLMSK